VGPRFGQGVFGLAIRGQVKAPARTRAGFSSQFMKTLFWFVLAICAMVLTGCGVVR
jgi:hypothetical protein